MSSRAPTQLFFADLVVFKSRDNLTLSAENNNESICMMNRADGSVMEQFMS